MEISRNVLAVLLLLVIVISGFGTWALLTAEPASPAADTFVAPSNNGEVTLTVAQVPRGQGVVALDIVSAREANNG